MIVGSRLDPSPAGLLRRGYSRYPWYQVLGIKLVEHAACTKWAAAFFHDDTLHLDMPVFTDQKSIKKLRLGQDGIIYFDFPTVGTIVVFSNVAPTSVLNNVFINARSLVIAGGEYGEGVDDTLHGPRQLGTVTPGNDWLYSGTNTYSCRTCPTDSGGLIRRRRLFVHHHFETL